MKPHLSLAEFYDAVGKPDEALAIYKKTLAKKPDDAVVKQALARHYFKHRQIDLAEQKVNEILNKQPKFFPARILSGEILLLKNESEQAVEII